ncbi:candidapepsin-4 precursor [Cordyceps fumosorosea ARSEF 2679]|uniref:Candidapepsin-4 n=1 Tax=Cordyceps fumosorosea (strain ARSEF 2679) TaxID=1081104 RepID=A0A167SWK9_CORFA|nr:candidapepsin-4 precursor [Cordyceps fumosorosea ARSEF 2679]OAA60003.1 candidapepsin-4 precursor [Cordyceps fumosorosea ARSEF 2679]
MITFGDNTDKKSLTSVDLQFYRDTVAFGPLVLENQTFGAVKDSQGQAQGILGLAPDLQAGFNDSSPYSLVLSSMVNQNLIASRVFSLNLRHSDDKSGSLIYGGLDRSKFMGRLEKVPIVNGLLGEPRLAVSLDTLGVTLPQSNIQFSNPVLGLFRSVMLDSGTTISRLQSNVAMPIIEALRGPSESKDSLVVPCSSQDLPGSVDFGFGGTTIRVPLKDFILKIGALCYVGITLTSGQQILGDTVLRAGYFVFDWDNKAVHIAQAAAQGQKCGKADIVAVGKGENAVPSPVQGKCSDMSPPLQTASASMSASKPTKTKVAGQVGNDASMVTTTYTVTACPAIDPFCETGVVRTATAVASPGGNSGSGKDSESGKSSTNPDSDAKDSGVGRYGVVGSLVAVLCSVSIGGMIVAWI